MPDATWSFDELAHAGPEHLDRQSVAQYDIKAGFDPLPEIEALRQAGLGRNSTLIDLGAGTGALSLAVAPFCDRVIAVDVSAAMVEVLKERVRESEATNVTVVQAGFLSYRHTGPPADFVYTRNALHHLPDFWKSFALVRIASMLRPSGILRLRDLVFSCEPREIERVVHEWLQSAPDDPGHGWTREELETHLREEHNTYSWLLEEMVIRAGFEIREATYSDSRVFAAYTCLKPT
jgi:ubiquinone/menaquinone biosynthesis C-methylase UbiE